MCAVEPDLSNQIAGRRTFRRWNINCRDRIVIGKRQYAGYIHNISPAGAKLRTVTLIRRVGSVILTLPDLSPIRCHLRWSDGYNAGVEFALPRHSREFLSWLEAKLQASPSGRSTILVADLIEAAPEKLEGPQVSTADLTATGAAIATFQS